MMQMQRFAVVVASASSDNSGSKNHIEPKNSSDSKLSVPAPTPPVFKNDAHRFIEEQFAKARFVVFYRTNCSYSMRAYDYFTTNFPEMKARFVNLLGNDNIYAIINELQTTYGSRISSVPQGFIDRKFVGDSTTMIATVKPSMLS